MRTQVKELADWAFGAMECCDEPEWSFFSRLYDICIEYLRATKDREKNGPSDKEQ